MNNIELCPLCEDPFVDHPLTKINEEEEVLVCFGNNDSIDDKKDHVLKWIDTIMNK
jgi:hypothetical protein